MLFPEGKEQHWIYWGESVRKIVTPRLRIDRLSREYLYLDLYIISLFRDLYLSKYLLAVGLITSLYPLSLGMIIDKQVPASLREPVH